MLMTFAVALWILMALGVLALFFYRSKLTAHEDDTLHVEHLAEKAAEQQTLAARLAPVDRWGKTLTIAAAAYGILIALYWLIVNYSDASRGM